MSKPVVLIIGAVPGLGQRTASVFAGRGWRVASGSRSRKDRLLDTGHLELHVDVTDLDSTENVFHQVKAFFGESPSVVIYNGFARSLHDANDPLSTITKVDVEREMNANTNSALIAAQQGRFYFTCVKHKGYVDFRDIYGRSTKSEEY